MRVIIIFFILQFKIPGEVFRFGTDTLNSVATNIAGGLGDAGKTGGNIINHTAKLASKGAERVSDFFGTVGNQASAVTKDGDLREVPGRFMGAAMNIAKNFGNNVVGAGGDVIDTTSNVIKEKMQLI